jgi:hypothetical protein
MVKVAVHWSSPSFATARAVHAAPGHILLG